MNTMTKSIMLAAVAAALAACGAKAGGAAAGGGGGTTPPPPPPAFGAGADQNQPKVVVSEDARSDYEKASAFFAEREKAGKWDEGACRSSADSFKRVASEHKKDLGAEAGFMVGLSYHKCGLYNEAEKAYRTALDSNPNHAQSLSNLGEIYYRQGKVDSAKQYWSRAVQAFQKLVAARNNLAALIFEDMKKTSDAARFAALDKEAQNHLSSVLAVDTDNIKAYTLYALVFMQGRQKNKNRLDLAKLLMDEAEKRKADYAPLKNARGLYFLYRNNLSQALESFQAAVQLDPKFVEARMNVGLTTLGFRKYDVAKEQFEKVIELQPKNYDAHIGLGIAKRGMGDFDGAEATYKRAKETDGRRGEAVYNLGVLYKDFKANQANDLKIAQQHYKTARNYFQDFQSKAGITPADREEAKNNIEDCDKLIKQMDDFMRAQANAPKAPAPAPTPAPAPAPPAKK